MKKRLIALILASVLLLALAGCGLSVPRPEIKQGRFNVSVTYEYNGEIKTASGVYICEYDGVIWYNPNRDPFVDWKESYEGDINEYGQIPLGYTDDGGEIAIVLHLYPEYFMGDPEHTHWIPNVYAEIFYADEQISDVERVAEYGVKVISYEYDEPIENTFN